MDDESTVIEGLARFGRPYLRIAAVVALGAGVLGLGIFGPHTAGTQAPTPAPSFLAANAPANPSAAASGPTSAPVATGIDALTGLTRVEPPAGELRQSWLPTQISSRSMAIIGLRLFYVVATDQIDETEIGLPEGPQTLVSVPRCQTINQLAAAGHVLAYVVTTPAGSSGGYFGCGGSSLVAWSVWLLDLDGGGPRQVAGGTRQASSIDVAELPVQIALTESAYAFDRPPSSAADGPGEAVEVHSIDGPLLWASRTERPVADVLLGGGALAILTDETDPPAHVHDLWRADAANPDPHLVDRPISSASLSRDGSYLIWDVLPDTAHGAPTRQFEVGIEALDSGLVQYETTLTGAESAVPLAPAVSATGSGPLVAWFATAPEGAVYPAFRYATQARGRVLSSVQEPAWMNLQGNVLIWVTEANDGWSTGAFAVDLSRLGSP